MSIKISPEELMNQAEQMTTLRNNYDTLFNNISRTLKSVNGNWSECLANNFAGKISSAQKSFAVILDTLDFGAGAAVNSAKTFTDIDSNLAKVLSGSSETADAVAGIGAVASTAGMFNNIRTPEDLFHYLNEKWDDLNDKIDGFWDKLDEKIPIASSMKWLEDTLIGDIESVGKIKDAHKVVDSTLNIADSDYVKNAQVIHDRLYNKALEEYKNGNNRAAAIYFAEAELDLAAGYGSAIVNEVPKLLLDKEAQEMYDGMNFYLEQADTKFSSGDIVGGFVDEAKSAGAGLLAIGETATVGSGKAIAKMLGPGAETVYSGIMSGTKWICKKVFS